MAYGSEPARPLKKDKEHLVGTNYEEKNVGQKLKDQYNLKTLRRI
jgi:hypothetical protein